MNHSAFQGPVFGRNFNPVAISGGVANIHYGPTTLHAVPRCIPYPRNEGIVPRPDLVAQLETLLPVTGRSQSAALFGLGGSGKTQLALDYAYRRCEDESCSVFWIHAESEASVIHDYQLIARVLDLEVAELSDEDMLKAVKIGIERQSNWVLVVDNSDNLDMFGVKTASVSLNATEMASIRSMNSFIPALGGTILWTSRDERIVGSLVHASRGIKIHCMTEPEAMQLLADAKQGTLSGSKEEEEATKLLLGELDRLPLAVYQAGAYMRETWTEVTEYLKMLQEGQQRWRILHETHHDRHRRKGMTNSILETWNISIDFIRRESDLAYKILHILAYLDNQNIQWEVVQRAAEYDETTLTPNPTTIRRALKRLSDFSFLTKRKEARQELSYGMHKLVQEGVRYRLSRRSNGQPQEPEPTATPSTSQSQSAVEQTAEGRKMNETYFAVAALQIIHQLFPNMVDQDNYHMWEQCENYFAHAISVANFIALMESKVEVANLMRHVLSYLLERGRCNELHALNEKILPWLQVELGNHHAEIGFTMAVIASFYAVLGRYNDAEELLLTLLCQFHETSEHSQLIASDLKGTLASIYELQERLKEANILRAEVLETTEKILGKMHTWTIDNAASLAQSYFMLEDYQKCEELGLQILAWRLQLHGEMHPTVLESYAQIAEIHIETRQYEEAEALQIKVLERRRQILGETHPSTVYAAFQLAQNYHSQGLYDMAEKTYKDTLEQAKTVLGNSHPSVIDIKIGLSATWRKLGQNVKAAELACECLEPVTMMHGSDHLSTCALRELIRLLGLPQREMVSET